VVLFLSLLSFIVGFSFAWLELVSHRSFLSKLLLEEDQKGWDIAHQLLIDLLLFLEPHLRRADLTDAIKLYYKGTLRVLLVLLHDFPSFLAGYHLSFCNVVPDNCIQLRNLILSAFPRYMVLPDPFTPNLKIDLLPEISQSPALLSNVLGPLGSLRGDLESYIKSRTPSTFIIDLLPLLYDEEGVEVDVPKVNSLVLYVGIQAIARLQNSQIAHTPEMEVFQKLMEFDDRNRYICLNAISNQLRYPSSHTHYFSCVMLFLFSEARDDSVKEQITRVLLERLIVHRPHPVSPFSHTHDACCLTLSEMVTHSHYLCHLFLSYAVGSTHYIHRAHKEPTLPILEPPVYSLCY
jgi:CCR4-NOT transcription complex subunit 1